MNRYDDEIVCASTIEARQGFTGPLNRSNIITDSLAAFPLLPNTWQVWDAVGTPIGAPANDDLGIGSGAFATGCPYISAGDMNGLGSTTRYARRLFELPAEYSSGNLIRLNASGGILAATNVCATSCVVDFECYVCSRDGLKSGSDLVTTAATTINSLTFGEKAFVVTPTGLIPGKILDIRLTITANHNSTGTTSIPILGAVEILLDVKG